MPRRERPLVPGDDPLIAFAERLRALRKSVGAPTYRELSRTAHYSVTVLSEAAGGRKLPSLAVTLAYAGACGGDPAEWRALWHETAAALATPPEPDADSAAPYLGLAAFQAADADRFFGRERLVEQLVTTLERRSFVGVFGASGSGKSSLLRAGLAARVGGVVLTPGARPVDECALRLAELTGLPAGTLKADLAADPGNLHLYLTQADVVLVVDQFEEVFTLCADAGERAWFVRALVHAAEAGDKVVIGVRADFYGHCGQYPELVDALRDSQVLVGPMTVEELRQAITQPAVAAGCVIETALVTRLVAEAAGQPAVLPLVSHALLETWRRRRGTRLTLAGYEEAGGIQHAVARSAEDVYTALTDAQRRAAKQIFLRLVALGDGTADTKRPLRTDTLDGDQDTSAVLAALAAARLVTIDDRRVEITHEALIRCWPRLRDWLADDRDGLRVHRQLGDATDVWESVDRDPGALYRGTRLDVAADWASGHGDTLTGRERAFLTASVAAHAAEQAAAVRTTRRLRRLIGLLTVLLLVAAGAIVTAVGARQTATGERNLAIARKAVSDAAAIRAENPALSVQLSLAAYRLAAIDETRDNLLSAFAAPYASLLTGTTKDLVSLQFSPDSRLLATASWDDAATLWAVTDVHHPRRLSTIRLDEAGRNVAFHPDGSVLATVTMRSVRFWRLTDPTHPVELGAITDVAAGPTWVAFSPDGRTLAVGYENHDVRLWDVTDVGHPVGLATLTGHTGAITSVAFSGNLLVTTGDTTARLWDVTDPRAPRPRGVLTGHTEQVWHAAFSPDGRTLATASWDHTARLWDIGDPDHPRGLATLTGDTSLVWSVAFSPDGRTLATSSWQVRLWDITEPTRPSEAFKLPGGAYAVTFSPDGTKLANSYYGARLQDVRELPLYGHDDFVSSVVYRRNLLVTSSWDGTVRLWDVAGPRYRRPVATLRGPAGFVRRIALSPDGHTVAAASDDGDTWLWDITDPTRPRVLGTLPQGVPGEVGSVAFSPDGRTLASAGFRSVVLWDVRDRTVRARLTDFQAQVTLVEFSPDGRTLMATDPDSRRPGRRWDVTDPAAPREQPFAPGRTEAAPGGAFSPTGQLMATVGNDPGANRTVHLRSQDLRPLSTLTGHDAIVYGVAFSPDGTRLATASGDRTVRLWDITDPAHPVLTGVLSGHTQDVTSVAFSQDSTWLATGSNDRTVRLWATTVDAVAARVCEVAHPRITEREWQRYFPGLPYTPPC